MHFFKNILSIILAALWLNGCNNSKNTPDVSNIKAELKLERFDNDFFKIDTLNIPAAINILQQKYPGFTEDYIVSVLGLTMDSVLRIGNRHAEAIKLFLRDYRPVKDSADKLFGDYHEQKEELESACRYIKHYFPEYKLPEKIYTFIGPVDAMFETSFGFQGDVLTANAFGTAVQFHLGENFSFYKSLQGQAQFPEYILKSLNENTIPVNAMRNVIDDMFPDNSSGKPLLEQMVEKGKRLYLLDRFLPNSDEHVKIGYTEDQLKKCYTNEGVIWGMFVNNDLLNNAEQNVIKNYIGDSPKTPELGDESPGNIAAFSGWQIVKEYMEKFPDTKLADLMKMDAREVYNKSKYKPK